jgi:hypothetical protein
MRSLRFRKQFLSKDTGLLKVAFILLLSAGYMHHSTKKPLIKISKQDAALNINKDLLVFFSLGNRRLFADLVWIQTLLESDLEHYSNRDLNNWLFLRFMTVQALDPNFYENYLYGGQFLAIIKDDLEGANVLYKKGIERFPEDFKLNFQAGFLNYFEIGDFKKALYYLSKIENNSQSPVYMKSIISKLKYSLSHDLEATFKLVLLNYQTTKDEKLKERLSKDLYAIRAEIDLKCLNEGKANCSYKDIKGDPYIKKEDGFHAPQFFLKYEIKTRKVFKGL